MHWSKHLHIYGCVYNDSNKGKDQSSGIYNTGGQGFMAVVNKQTSSSGYVLRLGLLP